MSEGTMGRNWNSVFNPAFRSSQKNNKQNKKTERMKIIKNLTFAALAVTLLFQTQITRAEGNDSRGERHHRDATATFTKWVTTWPIMAGVVGGNVGDGIFSGEVLKYSPGADPSSVNKIEALYHFEGLKHSFTALVHVEQTGSGPGTKAVIIGVVTDGWRKGHAVEGKYTEIVCDHDGVTSPCYQGSLEID